MELDSAKLTDRELLLILHTRQESMGSDIKEIKDDTKEKMSSLVAKVEVLEQHKVDKADFVAMVTEQEKRGRQIARLYNYLWFSFGALAILQIVLTVYLSIHR